MMRQILVCFMMLVLGLPAMASPLLVEGKKLTYQRILTKPGAAIMAAPNGAKTGNYPPFQILYVFERKDGFAFVGPNANGSGEGWVKESEIVDWSQNIVASFTNPANRDRQLLFDSQENLNELLQHEAYADMLIAYRKKLSEGEAPMGGVVSIEPEEHVDISKNFYLLPILQAFEEYHPMTGDPFLQMELASLPLDKEQGAKSGDLSDFEAGIVFVIDTTRSMDPFIEETRNAVAEMVTKLEASNAGKKLNFGVIGFRDNNAAIAELEYRTKIYAPLKKRDNQKEVVAALDAMEAAKASSPGFNEDALAGVEDAIGKIDWAAFGGRFVILVTDAGPKLPGDQNARSKIDADALREEARRNQIAVFTMHLRGKSGEANHAYAEGNYKNLSRFDGSGYYYPIKDGSREAFGTIVRSVIEDVTGIINVSAEKKLAEGTKPNGKPDVGAAGRAMQLAWLGRQNNAKAPELLRVWASDVDLEDPTRQALEPRLLVTKNQLSSLRETLKLILEAGEQTQASGESDEFFNQLKGAISRAAQNPELLDQTDLDSLDEAFGEFLADLPYKSRLQNMTEDRWANAGSERRRILDQLRARFQLYEMWNDDPEIWVKLHDKAEDGELVYAMPFSMLP